MTKTPLEAVSLVIDMGLLLAEMTTFIEDNLWLFDEHGSAFLYDQAEKLIIRSDRLSGTDS
jgi:hypothetical protein